MDFLKKIQRLPLLKRKIILWIILTIVSLIFLVIFIISTAGRLKNFQINDIKEDINFPSLETENLWPKK